MNTLDYILDKFSLSVDVVSPVKIVFKRYDLAGLFAELRFMTGAEIGVFQAHYSEVLCIMNDDLKLYAIDPWEVYETESFDPNAAKEDVAHENYELAKKRMAPYNCELVKKLSMDAVKDFKNESLDFVYIDANHDLKHVEEDIESWAKIVRPNGIISGHDYGHFKKRDRNLDAKKVIDAYVEKHNKKLFLVSRNFQTSWFFVK